MATRKKKVVISKLITRNGATDYLSKYAQAESEQKKLTGQMEMRINKIRDDYKEKLQELEAKKEDAFDHLHHFANTHEDLFLKKKSVEMAHGVIGFRTGTPKLKTLSGFTWAAVLKLVSKAAPNYIRTKEEIDKDKFIANREMIGNAELMDDCGIKVVQDETFYVVSKDEAVLA